MKKIPLLLFLVIASVTSFAQTDFVYTDVVKTDSVPAKDLYSRARLMIAKLYKSSNSVTQLNDDATNTLVIKPLFSVKAMQPNGFGIPSFDGGVVHYTVTIMCKDGRYKYTIDDMYHDGAVSSGCTGGALSNEKPSCMGAGAYKSWWKKTKEEADAYAKELIATIKTEMAAPKAGSGKQDW